ncbi:MAG TPA: hypothetical protein VF546_19785 [Pyrinomonadaceae bacterium]
MSSGVRAVALALLCVSVLSAPARAARPAADEAEVRGAVERAFEQLRRGEYEALYDALPTASQRRLPRERFVSGLEQTRNFYELQRLEINAVHVADELAVADTTVYARARMPFEAEGKIVARQYLVREGGRWRVTTGDRAAVTPLLAANPALAKRYPPTQPRLYVKRDGRWVDARTVFNNKRRPAG